MASRRHAPRFSYKLVERDERRKSRYNNAANHHYKKIPPFWILLVRAAPSKREITAHLIDIGAQPQPIRPCLKTSCNIMSKSFGHPFGHLTIEFEAFLSIKSTAIVLVLYGGIVGLYRKDGWVSQQTNWYS